MSTIKGLTRGGESWEPSFIKALDSDSCIGCGRCYKVCSRDVFNLVEKEDIDEDDDYYDEDEMMMTMVIEDELDCIGCGSCAKVCPKNCHSFEPVVAPA
ncbi:ferredoxin III, nif-specific [Vibrio algarum]|uniref:Ferredoxin III n=1 Tax=Vibrio algarum TaxID=3020714 RepID=A0ABT4YRX4_9VIBR|nr:ferredoxin III, nif-specific [Vibrio sp. KJ40-1]MDB1124157.1 ferredoxin III, nif-specific [Vibrio sp. KJ40-1]